MRSLIVLFGDQNVIHRSTWVNKTTGGPEYPAYSDSVWPEHDAQNAACTREQHEGQDAEQHGAAAETGNQHRLEDKVAYEPGDDEPPSDGGFDIALFDKLRG